MAALPDLITVEQFRRMPDDGRAYELQHGEVVAVTPPKAKHYELQRRLVRILESRLAGFGPVGMEFPYRPAAEFDLRVADVAVVEQVRYDRMDPDDNLRGAPELVIEIIALQHRSQAVGIGFAGVG
jgi:Uma2 family endonuclease